MRYAVLNSGERYSRSVIVSDDNGVTWSMYIPTIPAGSAEKVVGALNLEASL